MEEPIPGPSRDSIPLYLINGVATVWDAQVAATLHCTHGISGYRAGTLPGVSQQNVFLGLPITLMREETAYLVSNGIAHLVPVSRPPIPSKEQIQAHTQERVARIKKIEEKKRLDMEKKSKANEVAFERGGDKARAKREARAKAKAEKLMQGQTELVEVEVERKEPESVGYFHAVPSQPIFPTSPTPITSIPHPLFPFPSSPRDRALAGTFKDLSVKGLRVGLGPRFGGEYLIYPGDYLRYHAHFTSQVIVQDEPIRPAEIVAWGRLGTGTKKAGLLCCWDEGEMEYYSLEWANFG